MSDLVWTKDIKIRYYPKNNSGLDGRRGRRRKDPSETKKPYTAKFDYADCFICFEQSTLESYNAMAIQDNRIESVAIILFPDEISSKSSLLDLYAMVEQFFSTAKILSLNPNNASKAVEEKLKEITWLTKNVQKQWTSSYNPAIIDPADFYGSHYKRCVLGIEDEVETLLRLLRKTQGNVWYQFPNDCFNLIMEQCLLTQTD